MQLWLCLNVAVISFLCHLNGTKGRPNIEIIVVRRVKEFGQSLLLFCKIESCCPMDAGWTVDGATLFIDIKRFIQTIDPNSKYNATYDDSGMTLVIKNFSKQDINKTYECTYDFHSVKKFLLYDDVFSNNVPPVNDQRTNLLYIVGIVLVVVVVYILLIWKRKLHCCTKEKYKRPNPDGEERIGLNAIDNQTEEESKNNGLKEKNEKTFIMKELQNKMTLLQNKAFLVETEFKKEQLEHDCTKKDLEELKILLDTERKKMDQELQNKMTLLQNKAFLVETELKKEQLEHDCTKKDLEELKILLDTEREKMDQGRHTKDEFNKLEAELSKAIEERSLADSKVKGLETTQKELAEKYNLLTNKFNKESKERRKYYNMVEDMKGKIRVYCRIRPLIASEVKKGYNSVCVKGDDDSITVKAKHENKKFQFDKVFMEDSTQEMIFEDTQNLIQSAVDGYNVCIFAYGQTGSGKTFTLIGDDEQKLPGIAPRTFDEIFKVTQKLRSQYEIKVCAFMLELYNDKLIDLLANPEMSDVIEAKNIKYVEGWVSVDGVERKEVKSANELHDVFIKGSKKRHTASTNMNVHSSRSHLIISIVIESINKTKQEIIKGKLSLVDLAYCERVGKTECSGGQFDEGICINNSLLVLGRVITALSNKSSPVSYREDKLTLLMRDSLGGNAKTLMFVNISPADYNQGESVNCLKFASDVKKIKQESKNSEQVARLKSINARLKEKLNEYERR